MGVEREERRDILGKAKNQLWEENEIVREFRERERALEKGKVKKMKREFPGGKLGLRSSVRTI